MVFPMSQISDGSLLQEQGCVLCHGLNCVPPQTPMLKSKSLVPKNGTIWRRLDTFKKVIKLQ